MASNKSSNQKQSTHCFTHQPIDLLNEIEQQALIASVLTLLAEKHLPGQTLDNTKQTQQYLSLRLADQKAEVFGCLFLDSQHRVLADCELFHGTIDGAAVYPRVVLQKALECNAAAVVFYHNHCSGVAEPSTADQAITRRLKEALALVDIRVLDHLVVAVGHTVSMAERGLI